MVTKSAPVLSYFYLLSLWAFCFISLGIYSHFNNNAMPLNPSNPHVEISFGMEPKYAINVDEHQFEKGTYKRISDSMFSLKANNGN